MLVKVDPISEYRNLLLIGNKISRYSDLFWEDTRAKLASMLQAWPQQLHTIHELCSSGSKASDNSLPFLFLCHLVAPDTLEVMLVAALLVAGLAFCL